MTEHKELPEGVQIAIEMLQNVPEDMLLHFIERVNLFPDVDPKTHWDNIVMEQYDK